jgi:hypothetical protein
VTAPRRNLGTTRTVSIYRRASLPLRTANCILQIACQIVRITLGLVELAFGLHRLVARDFASGVLNRALGLVRGSLNGSDLSIHRWLSTDRSWASLGHRTSAAYDKGHTVRGPCKSPVWDWCTDNVPPPAAVPSSVKMPQAEQ